MTFINQPKLLKQALLLAGVCLLLGGAAQAQVRLYNEQKDKQAQAAAELAETIDNGNIFKKQLENQAMLARKDFITEFLTARMVTNAAVLNVLTWGDVLGQVVRVIPTSAPGPLAPSQPQIDQALAALDQAIANAQQALADFKAALRREELAVDPGLNSFFARLGDFADLLKLAEQLKVLANPRAGQAVAQISATIAELQKVYGVYTKQLETYNAELKELADVRLALKKVALQNLRVDEDYWKHVAAIQARRAAEQGLVDGLVNQYAVYAFQFGLTDFDPTTFPRDRSECDPAREDCARKARERFRAAVEKASVPGHQAQPRHSQTLAASGQELAAQLQALERDDDEVLRRAKAAQRELAGDTANLSETVKPVLKALDDAVSHCNPRDLVHQDGLKMRAEWLQAAKALRDAGDTTQAEQALRGVVVAVNHNTGTRRAMAVSYGAALFDLAALLARGDTPDKLAQLRLTHAARVYSIHKSAVNARAYELVVSGGVKRLALYHKGGIKPETLASFVHALSTLAIPPAILTK